MTTNQTLFRQLLASGALDDRLRGFKKEGRTPSEVYEVLYNESALQAAQAFEGVHARWPWEGRVSQEASALLTELDPLLADVRRISQAMSRAAAFTKIPNLKVGPQAIVQAVAGDPPVCPNVTLVFSDRHYVRTAEGYLLGLSKRVARSGDLSKIHSVNSLFVSRVDRVVDPMIEEHHRLLAGKTAVAQAKKVYQMFEAIFLGIPFEDPEGLYADAEGKQMLETLRRLSERFAALKPLGANPQRLLIASSGVKSDQPYPELLYVLPFLGPWTANTLPEGTLTNLSRFVEGLSDEKAASLKKRHLMREGLPNLPTDQTSPVGWIDALLMEPQERVRKGIPEISADRVLRELHEKVLAPRGTSLRTICDTLRDKGAQSFLSDEQATLQAIQDKLQGIQ